MRAPRLRRLWLVVCLMVLGGLVTTVPVNCLCEVGEHVGQPVHSALPHSHARAAEPAGTVHASGFESNFALSITDVGHGSTAPVSELFASTQLVTITAILALLFTRMLTPRARLPESFVLLPVTAPPRLRPRTP